MSKKKDKILENFNKLFEALKQNPQNSNVMYFKKEEYSYCPSKSLYFSQDNLKQYNDICDDFLLFTIKEKVLDGIALLFRQASQSFGE